MSASGLLQRYVKALDDLDFRAVIDLFAADSEYRVQMRGNFERNGVLHLVRDSHQSLRLRCETHPANQLQRTRHVLGEVTAAADGQSAQANFSIERDGKPTFVGEYRLRLAPGEPARFKELLAVLDGDSCPGQILVPI
jgi:3-phenylpropionate/cinnamic acid dioxygenase small subunit